MPPRETPAQRRRRIAVRRGIVFLPSDFSHICRKRPHRIGVVAEGDSWFSYPRKWIVLGADINTIHHLEEKVENTDSVICFVLHRTEMKPST